MAIAHTETDGRLVRRNRRWRADSDYAGERDHKVGGGEMKRPTLKALRIATVAATLIAVVPFGMYEIDRSEPLVYREAWYEAVPAEGQKVGSVITEAAPGQQVVLALKIEWPRTNCSTELQRSFIGSDKAIYKVPLAAGEPSRLGPPPAQFLAADRTFVSRRRVTLPAELPGGVATHSPSAWVRCTSPAVKWGDYLTELWPIFVGPKGADAQIMIRR